MPQGLLFPEAPLTWDEAKLYAEHVRSHGAAQFLHASNRDENRPGSELFWTNEIDFMVITFDDQTKHTKLSLRQPEILSKLAGLEHDILFPSPSSSQTDLDAIETPNFHLAYGRYMLGTTLGSPYTDSIQDLLFVEPSMRHRRRLVRKCLNANEVPMTLTSFPRLGASGVFTDPCFGTDGAESSRSLLLPEEITSPHPCYSTLTANIRKRRGCKVAINIPIFIDDKTSRPFVDPTIPWQRSSYPEDAEAKDGAALIDHIYMDATPFGTGCCCSQLAFQCANDNDARRMYDALIPVIPIMMALTAASPIWRGYLSDVDCHWNVIAGSVDDRTAEELGRTPLKKNKYIIPKSRFDSARLYLSTDVKNKPAYNDIDVPYNQETYSYLIDQGMDELLSKHMAHLFIRDPLLISLETINQDDNKSNDHLESIQSANWQPLRFKPPPPESPVGWGVEFRSMELQPTDFENAAFTVFVVLLCGAILAFDLNFYIPMSKVDENIARAQKRDAVRTGKFFFRKSVLPPGYISPLTGPLSSSESCTPKKGRDDIPERERVLGSCFHRVPSPPVADALIEDEYEEMTMEEIFSGKGTFPGLLRFVEAYLRTLDMDPSERGQMDRYIDFVRRRANGSLLTPARWMREFVRSHPLYKRNSVVGPEINYNLIVAVDEIEKGVRRVPELLPEDYCGSEVRGTEPLIFFKYLSRVTATLGFMMVAETMAETLLNKNSQ